MKNYKLYYRIFEKKSYIKEKCYEILCGKCLFVVTSGKKSNLSSGFKLELMTIY